MARENEHSHQKVSNNGFDFRSEDPLDLDEIYKNFPRSLCKRFMGVTRGGKHGLKMKIGKIIWLQINS